MGNNQSIPDGDTSGIQRLEDTRTVYDSAPLAYKGSADPNCIPNDDVDNMWGWGQTIVVAGNNSYNQGIELMQQKIPRILNGLWWGYLICSLILLATAGVAWGFASNARPDLAITTGDFDGTTGLPAPSTLFTFPVAFVIPVGPLLAGIFLLIPVFRGTRYIAQTLIDHAAGWSIYAPHVSLTIFEALLVCVLAFIRYAFPLFVVAGLLGLVGFLYLLVNEDIAKQHTWEWETVGKWIFATLINLGLWAYIIAFEIINRDAIAAWEHGIIATFVVLQFAKWLNVTLYIYGDSLSVPNYPNVYWIYVVSWKVLYMVEALVIYWVYIGIELL
jgi:hypothetical protein